MPKSASTTGSLNKAAAPRLQNFEEEKPNKGSHKGFIQRQSSEKGRWKDFLKQALSEDVLRRPKHPFWKEKGPFSHVPWQLGFCRLRISQVFRADPKLVNPRHSPLKISTNFILRVTFNIVLLHGTGDDCEPLVTMRGGTGEEVLLNRGACHSWIRESKGAMSLRCSGEREIARRRCRK